TKITEALFRFQSICESPKKDSYNPHFKSKYASLESVMNAVVPALRETGLLLLQDPVREGNSIGVKTRIIHKSGEWIEFEPVIVSAGKLDGHGVGSSLTYARRYAISTALELATQDDDDNAAANPQTKQQPKQQAQRRQQSPPPVADPPQQQSGSGNPLKRLFAIANEKGISDKALKGLCFYYFNKASRTELTGEELNQFANILQSASSQQLQADLTAAVQVYQSRKGQMAPLTAEEVDQVLGLK